MARAHLILNSLQEDETAPLLLRCIEIEIRRMRPETVVVSKIVASNLNGTMNDDLKRSSKVARAECKSNQGADFSIVIAPMGLGTSVKASQQEDSAMALTLVVASRHGIVDMSVQTFSISPLPKELNISIAHIVGAEKELAVQHTISKDERSFAQTASAAVTTGYMLSMDMLGDGVNRSTNDRKKMI